MDGTLDPASDSRKDDDIDNTLTQGADAGIVDRRVGTPLWLQVRNDLRRRVLDGRFSGGFPGELSLVAEYGVSRHTVREALRGLRSEGIVTAERGRAPRVADALEITQPLGALYSLFAAVESAGLVQQSIVRVIDIRADGVVATRLGLEESSPLVHIERLRLAGGQPLALDRVWLPAALAAPLLGADLTHTALYDELDRRCGVRLSGGREELRAVVPSAQERRLLDIGPAVAAFAVERVGCVTGPAAEDHPVEWRHTLIRGDRFAVSAEFSGRHGYRLQVAAPTRNGG